MVSREQIFLIHFLKIGISVILIKYKDKQLTTQNHNQNSHSLLDVYYSYMRAVLSKVIVIYFF